MRPCCRPSSHDARPRCAAKVCLFSADLNLRRRARCASNSCRRGRRQCARAVRGGDRRLAQDRRGHRGRPHARRLRHAARPGIPQSSACRRYRNCPSPRPARRTGGHGGSPAAGLAVERLGLRERVGIEREKGVERRPAAGVEIARGRCRQGRRGWRRRRSRSGARSCAAQRAGHGGEERHSRYRPAERGLHRSGAGASSRLPHLGSMTRSSMRINERRKPKSPLPSFGIPITIRQQQQDKSEVGRAER